MVVDTSILLAIFFNEKKGVWAADQLQVHALSLRMSTVNLAETLILVQDKQPQIFEEIRETILNSSIRFVPPTVRQAEMASKARLLFPINLGDCFAYALAKDEGCPILTMDKAFRKTDIHVVLPSS